MYYYELSPRFAETDAMGHINNTAMPVWFEKAREPIYELFFPRRDLSKANLITAKYEIKFNNEVRYEQDVVISTGIARIGNSSIIIKQQVLQNDKICATGNTTMVYFDYQRKKSGPIPDAIRKNLGKYMFAPVPELSAAD